MRWPGKSLRGRGEGGGGNEERAYIKWPLMNPMACKKWSINPVEGKEGLIDRARIGHPSKSIHQKFAGVRCNFNVTSFLGLIQSIKAAAGGYTCNPPPINARSKARDTWIFMNRARGDSKAKIWSIDALPNLALLFSPIIYLHSAVRTPRRRSFFFSFSPSLLHSQRTSSLFSRVIGYRNEPGP